MRSSVWIRSESIESSRTFLLLSVLSAIYCTAEVDFSVRTSSNFLFYAIV